MRCGRVSLELLFRLRSRRSGIVIRFQTLISSEVPLLPSLRRAELFADGVSYAATDQCGGGGPVMQAEHQAGHRRRHSRDFHDHADEFEMRVSCRACCRHCFPLEKSSSENPRGDAEARPYTLLLNLLLNASRSISKRARRVKNNLRRFVAGRCWAFAIGHFEKPFDHALRDFLV